MSEYTINGKPLSDFGIIPVIKGGNTLALTGAWDLPKRKGDSSYDWLEKNDVEAFVDAEDMLYEGRTITLVGIMVAKGDQTIEGLSSSLMSYLNSLEGVYVLSSQWGDWQVQTSDEIKINQINADAAEVELKFYEPNPDLSGELPTTSTGDDIDSYAWVDFGFEVLDVDGVFSIPSHKSINVTVSVEDNSKIYGGMSAKKINISGIIVADTYAEFTERIHSLYALFTAPGIRRYKYKGIVHKCFAPEGFTISNVGISAKTKSEIGIILTTVNNDE